MVHITRIKVRGFHLDVYGHVNNARFLEFLEEARWEFIEEYIDLNAWKKQGYAFVIVNININYRSPATLSQSLEIRSSLTDLGRRKATITQTIYLSGTSRLVADAKVTFVIVDIKTGKALALKGEIGDLFRSITAERAGQKATAPS